MNTTRCLDVRGIPKFSRRSSISYRKPNVTSKEHAPNETFCKSVIGNLTVIMSDSETNTSEENLRDWYDWIGRRVSIGGIKIGVLRYFGSTEFSSGNWCGVELDEPVGKNNGTVKGVQYFVCEDKYGIFAPLSKTIKLLDEDQLQPPANPLKSRLLSPKLKQKFMPNSETVCDNAPIDFNRSIHYNMNNETTDSAGDMFKTLRKQPGPVVSTRKFGFNQMNNNDMVRNKILSRRSVSTFRTDFSNPASEDVNDNEADLLNRTVTIQNNKTLSLLNQNTNLNSTVSYPTNTEFNEPLVPNINTQDRLESTFILSSHNRRSMDNLDKQFGSHENLLSFDCDDSLGILSPSEMKDFSSSLENTFLDPQLSRSKIPKNLSCDDVKEIPEFEMHPSFLFPLPAESPSVIEGSTCQLPCDGENQNFISQMIRSSPDVTPLSGKIDTNENHQRLLKLVDKLSFPVSTATTQLTLPDELDYNYFSTSCKEKAFKSSLQAENSSFDHRNNRSLNEILATITQETTICNTDVTLNACANDKSSEELKCNITSQAIIDHNRLFPDQHPSRFSSSFSALEDETLPNAVLSFSELNTEAQNFLGLSQPADNPILSISKDLLLNLSHTDPQNSVVANPFCEDQLKNTESEQIPCAQNVPNQTFDNINKCTENVDMDMLNFKSAGTEAATIIKFDSMNEALPKWQVSGVTASKATEDCDNNLKQTSHLVQLVRSHTDLLTSSPINIVSGVSSTNILVPENTNLPCLDQTVVVEVGKLIDLSGSLNLDQMLQADIPDTICPAVVDKNATVIFGDSEEAKATPDGNTDASPNIPNSEQVIDVLACEQMPDVNSKPLNSTFDLNKTYDKKTLPDAMTPEGQNRTYDKKSLPDAMTPEDQNENREKNVTNFASPQFDNASINESMVSPCFGDGIEDISRISPNCSDFSVGDISNSFNAAVSISNHRDTTFVVHPDGINQKKSDFPIPGRKSMFPRISISKIRQSTPLQTSKTSRITLLSKLADEVESTNKQVKNQENMNTTKVLSTQKKPGKWDAVTSKIAASLIENKSPKVKKDIASKVNTNLGASRQSTPKTSPGPMAKFRKSIASTLTLESKTKTAKKNPLLEKKTNNKNDDGDNRESRILSQLQNVNPPKPNEFKVPLNPVRRKTGLFSRASSQLPSPTESTGTTNSVPAKLGVGARKSMPLRTNTPVAGKKPDLAVPAGAPPKIMNRPGIGQAKVASNKDAKPARWSTGSLPKTPNAKPEPRKFISKTELVREIQELGANCENRTKELNLLKIRLRHATLGLEALAILNKYMMEEYDPFSQPRLKNEYNKAKDELYHAGEQLQVYRQQLDELQTVHADELMELTEKLGVVHADEILELKSRHSDELADFDIHHKHRVKKLNESFKNEAEESEEQNIRSIKELQDDHERQKRELEESHGRKVSAMEMNHEAIQFELNRQLESLHSQYSALQQQLRQAESAFMRDKNARIQYMSSKKTELENEVDSLKAVLEIKTSEIQDLHRENFKIKKQLEELPVAKEKIRKLESKTEDLKAVMQKKVKLHRELSSENQQLVMSCEKEAKTNSRLLQANEELQWRLQQSMETSLRSTSLCASPEMWGREEDQRSSSRMSLPILQSERARSLTDSPIHSTIRVEDRPTTKFHSMSMSWHPALPTHAELPSAPETSTPLQSFRGSRFNPSPQSRLSIIKLKKDIETDILRRNSSFGQRLPTMSRQSGNSAAMSMSWGGETFSDYYDELDDSCLQICAEQQSGLTRKYFIKCDNDRKRGRKSKQLSETLPEQEVEMSADKSLSGSLQSSYYSSSDSCSSYLPTQPGSDASNSSPSSSSGGEKSQDQNLYDVVPPTVKPPREQAGESMVQEMEALYRIMLQESVHLKPENGSSITDASSSSPEDGKDNGANVASVATPSMETSSQGMADSTNLDVSWGDEEMPSEND